MRLILASGSPRRRDLLASLGLRFEIRVPEIDETPLEGESPEEYVLRLARRKADQPAGPGMVTLAADTTVVHRGAIIGKPEDPGDARRILAILAGEIHTVLTAVAVQQTGDDAPRIEVELSRTDVQMTRMSAREIEAYVASGEPMDKAGAYAMQGAGAMFVAAIRGSPTNVIGLPLDAAVRLLRASGVEVPGASS